MVDALSAIAGNAYSGYNFPAKTQNSEPAGQTGGSVDTTNSLSSVYDPYDLDGDGVLSYSEYQAYLEAMGLLQSLSSITLDPGESQTVSAETAKAAYHMNAGSSRTSNLSGQTSGTGTYTPVDLMA